MRSLYFSKSRECGQILSPKTLSRLIMVSFLSWVILLSACSTKPPPPPPPPPPPAKNPLPPIPQADQIDDIDPSSDPSALPTSQQKS